MTNNTAEQALKYKKFIHIA